METILGILLVVTLSASAVLTMAFINLKATIDHYKYLVERYALIAKEYEDKERVKKEMTQQYLDELNKYFSEIDKGSYTASASNTNSDAKKKLSIVKTDQEKSDV